MSEKQTIKQFILLALLKMEGMPATDRQLEFFVFQAIYPRPTITDFRLARDEMESDGFLTGSSDDITGKSWSLTVKGEHKAKQLK